MIIPIYNNINTLLYRDDRAPETGPFALLPNEIIKLVFSFLGSNQDQRDFSLVCQRFRFVVWDSYKTIFRGPNFSIAAQNNSLPTMLMFDRANLRAIQADLPPLLNTQDYQEAFKAVCQNGSIESLEWFIDQHPDKIPEYGWEYAYLLAASAGNEELMNCLLDKQHIDSEFIMPPGGSWTALLNNRAAAQDPVLYPSRKLSHLALSLALSADKIDLVEKLLEKAKLTGSLNQNETASYLFARAIRRSDFPHIKVFLRAGMDPRNLGNSADQPAPNLLNLMHDIIGGQWQRMLREGINEYLLNEQGPTLSTLRMLLANKDNDFEWSTTWCLKDSYQSFKVAYFLKLSLGFKPRTNILEDFVDLVNPRPSNKDLLKQAGFLAIACLIDVIARVSTIAELVIKGLGNLILSTKTGSRDFKLGLKQLFIFLPIQIFRFLFIPFDISYQINLICLLSLWRIKQSRLVDFRDLTDQLIKQQNPIQELVNITNYFRS